MADKDAPKEEPKHGEPVTIEHPDPPKKPLVMPDGHEVVTKEDIDGRG